MNPLKQGEHRERLPSIALPDESGNSVGWSCGSAEVKVDGEESDIGERVFDGRLFVRKGEIGSLDNGKSRLL